MARLVEHGLHSDPDKYLKDVIEWRPDLPVDKPDISHILYDGRTLPYAGPPGYAWERFPRWLAETKEAFSNVDGPIVCLDICSSVPLYAQLMRAGEFARSGKRAREIERWFFSDEAVRQLKHLASTQEGIPAERALTNSKLPLINTALAKEKTGRLLLSAAIQRILFTLTNEESLATTPLTQDGFRTYICEQLACQDELYIEEPEKVDMETRWGYRYTTNKPGRLYYEILDSLPILTDKALEARRVLAVNPQDQAARAAAYETEAAGPKLAGHYITWQANFLASHIAGNHRFRPCRFLSMDIEDPEMIAMSSISNTPRTTKEMNLFPHALISLYDERQHVVGDIFKPLPFPDNSLALITCFDGWPFHFGFENRAPSELGQAAEKALAVLHNMYDKLAYGGKVVIFPWSIAGGGSMEQMMLDSVDLEFSRRIRRAVEKKVIHKDVLMEWMSESDLETSTKHSRLFQSDNPRFEALIITKPRESSLKAQMKKNIGYVATSGAQNLG